MKINPTCLTFFPCELAAYEDAYIITINANQELKM